VNRDLPHFLSFFLFTDILLLTVLGYFSNLYASGLLTFFLFLIIIVALRASFRLSLILGTIMVLAYFFSSYLISGPEFSVSGRMLLGAVSLISVSAFCGWFSEGKSRLWQAIHSMSQKLHKVGRDLGHTRRRLELYKEIDELRSHFTAVMSHELRTPLTGIIGFADIMLMGEAGHLTDRQKDFLSEMLQKALELCRLIDNLMDFSRIQSGRWDLRLERIAPGTIVKEAIASTLPAAGRRNVEILHLPPQNDLPEIVADRKKIERSLVNIIGNAVKFSPVGGRVEIRETVGTDPTLAENFPHLIASSEVVTFSVTDNGPGVPEEERLRIFESMYHVRGKGGGVSQRGVGLGLSIAKEVIGLHWGKLWHEEAPGGGSIFRFTLPVRPIRPRRKIELVKSDFDLGLLLEGLCHQFKGEIDRKGLSLARRGWPGEAKRPRVIRADRKLLQCVLYNILNNQIRYAMRGSDLLLSVEQNRRSGRFVIRFENRGELMNREVMERFRNGETASDDPSDQDLRRFNINMTLVRDIIESHGGSFLIENLEDQGVVNTISLPVPGEAARKGARDEAEKNPDRRG
jgi:signal transduction histidine kinase